MDAGDMNDVQPEQATIAALADRICDELCLQTDMAREIARLALRNLVLFDQKQQDYGSGNIAAWGELGVAVRCTDKVMRLRQLLATGREPRNEAVVDSFRDLANYGLIGEAVRAGVWR